MSRVKNEPKNIRISGADPDHTIHLPAAMPPVLFSWGRGHFGQLGHGGQDADAFVPRPVPASLDWGVSIAVGSSDASAAVSSSGKAYSWGFGSYGKLGHGDQTGSEAPRAIATESALRSVVLGPQHGLGVSVDGELLVWGRNKLNELGIGPEQEWVRAAVSVTM